MGFIASLATAVVAVGGRDDHNPGSSASATCVWALTSDESNRALYQMTLATHKMRRRNQCIQKNVFFFYT